MKIYTTIPVNIILITVDQHVTDNRKFSEALKVKVTRSELVHNDREEKYFTYRIEYVEI